MLTVKAKHATMLLTVSEVEGLSDGMDELSDEELPTKQPPAHPSVVMVRDWGLKMTPCVCIPLCVSLPSVSAGSFCLLWVCLFVSQYM